MVFMTIVEQLIPGMSTCFPSRVEIENVKERWAEHKTVSYVENNDSSIALNTQ